MATINHYKGGEEVAGAIGEHLDKMLEQSKAESLRCSGGKAWLREAANRKLLSVHAAIDRDVESGKLKLSTFEGDFQLVSLVKSYVTKCIECLQNLSSNAEAQELVANGKVAALEASLTLATNYYKNAQSRMKHLLAEAEEKARILEEEFKQQCEGQAKQELDVEVELEEKKEDIYSQRVRGSGKRKHQRATERLREEAKKMIEDEQGKERS